jgi:hypothetical protein
MTALEYTTIKRGGRTARHWYETINQVSIDDVAPEVRFEFEISSKGGGDTRLQMRVAPGDFPAILSAMSKVDRQAAIDAMSFELGLLLGSEGVMRLALSVAKKEAASEITEGARDKYLQGKQERAFVQGIRGIVAEIGLDQYRMPVTRSPAAAPAG